MPSTILNFVVNRLAIILMFCAGALIVNAEEFSREKLAAALLKEDLAAVKQQVAAAVVVLGDKAGVPDIADTFTPIPDQGRWLTVDEARTALKPLNRYIERKQWWKIRLDPTKLSHALRERASVVLGCAAAQSSHAEDSDRSLILAKEAADFLIWAQKQAGTGGFPFPAARGVAGDNAFVSADKYLARAERNGKLDQIVHNGWCIDDATDGGLQFDNGQAGAAMFELFQVTRDKQYLDSAVAAANWAMARPMVTNWNYNSFSVFLLAKAYEVTGDTKYLNASIKKALIGVIPGQLLEGPNAGRWIDGHNARPVYHYIMMRALASLVAVMPKDDPARSQIVQSLRLGLIARNNDLFTHGATNKDYLIEALIRVNRAFHADPSFLKETRSAEALDRLGGLASEQFRKNNASLSPSVWGMFLGYVTSKPDTLTP